MGINVRKYQKKVEFANFICHFGEYGLLHYLEEIVLPGLLKGPRVRKYGEQNYFLHETELIHVKNIDGVEEPAICGRFVLDTILRRDQIFVDNKLVEDEAAIKSAPSSIFVLTLSNHKLVFCKEVSGAPGMQAFGSTLESILRTARIGYVNRTYDSLKALSKEINTPKITKQTIVDSIPRPSIELVPLTGTASVKQFFEQFSKLKEIKIEVLKPNHEIDNDKLIEQLQQVGSDLKAVSTSMTHKNNDGLDKVAAADHFGNALDGNVSFTAIGSGEHDERIVLSNDDVKTTVPVTLEEKIPVTSAAQKLFSVFRSQLSKKLISIAKSVNSPEDNEKLLKLNNISRN